MKTLIIYKSINKRNTEKIARVMAKAMKADLVSIEEAMDKDLEKYDLIGFGSGIYASKFHKSIYKFIAKIPSINKKVFVFCTSGSGEFTEKNIREKLLEKGCKIIGVFSCPGQFDMLGLTLSKKGYPKEEDFEKARVFASNLLNS